MISPPIVAEIFAVVGENEFNARRTALPIRVVRLVEEQAFCFESFGGSHHFPLLPLQPIVV